jgi:hypothetical protein
LKEFLQRVLKYNKSLTLYHHGDCSLLGVSLDFELYIEEVYGEDDEVSRYSFNLESDFDPATKVREIYTIPNSITRPLTPQHTTLLNFNIGRYRGLREAERIADLVQPLTIEEKMALAKFLPTPIMPPLLLGIAESTVLAEAPLNPPHLYLVCRRVRLAYALTQPLLDSSRQKYDYDTAVLHFIHLYDVRDDDEHPLHETIASGQSLLDGVVLHKPMDCLIHDNHLFIADGGDDTRTSAVHIWTISKNDG